MITCWRSAGIMFNYVHHRSLSCQHAFLFTKLHSSLRAKVWILCSIYVILYKESCLNLTHSTIKSKRCCLLHVVKNICLNFGTHQMCLTRCNCLTCKVGIRNMDIKWNSRFYIYNYDCGSDIRTVHLSLAWYLFYVTTCKSYVVRL